MQIWFDSPAVRWVLVDRGILWVLRLLSGQTYPAVLSAQTHHRCPAGGQSSLNPNIFVRIPISRSFHKHWYLCGISLMGFLCPLSPFQGYGVYPSSHGRGQVDAHIQTQIRTDRYLNAFFWRSFYGILILPPILYPHIFLLTVMRGLELFPACILDRSAVYLMSVHSRRGIPPLLLFLRFLPFFSSLLKGFLGSFSSSNSRV